MKKYTIAIDFDGVIHSYTSPWVAPHVIPDGPVPGVIEWLHATIQDFEVVILTTRGKTWRGRRAVRRWLRHYAGDGWWFDETESRLEPGSISGDPGIEIVTSSRGLERVSVTAVKHAALVYIDDRAFRFDGANLPTAQQIHAARPWNKPLRESAHGTPQRWPVPE